VGGCACQDRLLRPAIPPPSPTQKAGQGLRRAATRAKIRNGRQSSRTDAKRCTWASRPGGPTSWFDTTDLTDFSRYWGCIGWSACAPNAHTTLAFNQGAPSEEVRRVPLARWTYTRAALGKKCEEAATRRTDGRFGLSITPSRLTFRSWAPTRSCSGADCHHDAPGHGEDGRCSAGSVTTRMTGHLGQYGAQCDRCHSVDFLGKGARIQ